MEDTTGQTLLLQLYHMSLFPASCIYGFRRLDRLRHTAETFMPEPYIRVCLKIHFRHLYVHFAVYLPRYQVT